MSISITQQPTSIQAAQSPMVFTVLENTSSFVTGSEFQYTAELYIWDGTLNQSGSYEYSLRKFPNTVNSGIFDVSKFVNSSLTDLSATNGSNIKYYKAVFGWQYESGSTYATQSVAISSSVFRAIDGYNLFPQQINTSVSQSTSYWPILSDMGSVTQSVTANDTANLGGNLKGLSIWTGVASGSGLATTVECTASYANGTQLSATTALLSGSTTSSAQITHLPNTPGESSWGTYWPTTVNLASYVFVVKNGATVLTKQNYKVDCAFYYEPIRVAYKNRYGQFDFINFYKRNDKVFNTEQRVYQPQLGTWESATLSYNQFQTSQQRYIVDSTETISCNTDFLSDGYNELMKQLMVSDEIYWCYDQTNNLVKPLTIQTNSLQFKTGVNNKLIQYTITFDIGQPYKLLL